MKQVLFITAALGALLLTAPAKSADLPLYTKAPAIAAPAYDWSGFYLGVFGGGGFGNHNLNNALGSAGFANYTINYSSSGGIAGGEIGYNVQSGNIVVGVEATASGPASGAAMSGSSTPAPCRSARSMRPVCATVTRSGPAAASRSTGCCCSSPAAGPMATSSTPTPIRCSASTSSALTEAV
ncbi:hypothetical protein [Bradyrhizobium tropiciagri]|uniref:hypothetical protein n=1 Tax=Bradyrhizobium tropiciagri TaxID=312253 RepID=UPI00067B309A|nr:hypothetical protein [Bradyrhizobium tropiciagri]